jgi:hypothetical protein
MYPQVNPKFVIPVIFPFLPYFPSMSIKTIYAVSGAENNNDHWAELTKAITSGDAENPRKGSMGVNFNINENLANIYASCEFDLEKVKIILRSKYASIKNKDMSPLSPHQIGNKIGQLKSFMELAEGDETLFCIKQGTRARWLMKRVGHYRFDPANNIYKHRISYEYVRDITDEERLTLTLAHKTRTIGKITVSL